MFAASVWYTFTPDQDGTIFISTAGSTFDTTVAAYEATGPNITDLVQVGCNDDSGSALTSALQFDANTGTTYYVQAASVDENPADLVISFEFAEPPPNDNFLVAIDASPPFSDAQRTVVATEEATEPPDCNSTPIGKTVWYSWQLPTPAQSQ